MRLVSIVGAGPGDPELLTIRASRRISGATVILYDRLVSKPILEIASRTALLESVGKEEGEQKFIQQDINRKLIYYWRQGHQVVRLKGGDPMVFGRGAEEWHSLASQGIPVEIVPGVSSAIGVPGAAGIPPTFRGIAGGFAVLTGHRAEGFPENLSRYAQVETLIILMGVRQRAEIARALIAAGRPAHEPAAFIENGTTPLERIIETTLGGLGQAQVQAPAVLVIGEVVRVRGALRALAVAA
jgi:uroporphyrin-III C-methyltransferase